MNYVIVEKPEHGQPLQYCRVVAAAVLLELPCIQVEGEPVNLHNEETFQEEVNAPNAVDPDLGLSGNAGIPKQHSGQGLKEGICATIHLGQHVPGLAATIAGQVAEEI
ncbi:MAG TPA: hypothetical protein VIQ52_01410 [Arthrobacter sp.]